MVIGSISFTSTRSQSINQLNTNSFHNNDLVNEANSSASNANARAAGQIPTAADKSFSLTQTVSTYIDPNTGQLYAAGSNAYGQLGLGYDEGNLGLGIKDAQHTFTPLYKSGDKNQPFINPIDWGFGFYGGSIIDADGKLWTAGSQIYGALGNGVFSRSNSDGQLTFESANLLGLPEDYKAVAVRNGFYNDSPLVIVMLDNGDFYGTGRYFGLGFSSTGGTKQDGTPGGNYYTTFTKLNDRMEEFGMDPSKIVDFEAGLYHSLYLLDDGSLWRCSSNGYENVTPEGENIVTLDSRRNLQYYISNTGDVYYAINADAFNKILSKTDETVPTYVGDIKEIVTSGASGWAYLTTSGDVYYTSTDGGNELTKIASDVVYFDIGGYNSGPTFGAITKDGQFKLWGNDSNGMLGNGENEGATPNWDYNNPSLDAFESEEATQSTPTTDGTVVTPPAVNEDGTLVKDPSTSSGNKPIDTALASPAPA